MNLHLSTMKLAKCRKMWPVNFPDKGMGAKKLSIQRIVDVFY